ncbi:hypothetical protein [Staphylococcus auricularis]|uniref:hypothetical protein n=1 Tax=Staphylococcus auricularis TaxID=29379 RepID=UPI0012449A3B|nr:hypothetical protein [Staphylococcus auricularis]
MVKRDVLDGNVEGKVLGIVKVNGEGLKKKGVVRKVEKKKVIVKVFERKEGVVREFESKKVIVREFEKKRGILKKDMKEL